MSSSCTKPKTRSNIAIAATTTRSCRLDVTIQRSMADLRDLFAPRARRLLRLGRQGVDVLAPRVRVLLQLQGFGAGRRELGGVELLVFDQLQLLLRLVSGAPEAHSHVPDATDVVLELVGVRLLALVSSMTS